VNPPFQIAVQIPPAEVPDLQKWCKDNNVHYARLIRGIDGDDTYGLTCPDKNTMLLAKLTYGAATDLNALKRDLTAK
jgi:hypothetical protein